MGTETNKQVVNRFFDFVDAGAFDEAFALMTEDATWWFPSDAPGGTTMTKAQMRATIDMFGGVFRDSPKMVRGRMTAEGGRVCLEQHSRGGVTHGGATYGNDYHMLLELRDGLICEIREYMNPLLAAGVTAEMQAAAPRG